MHLRALQLFKKLTCLAIISLTLWLGGFGCSACCASELGKVRADNDRLSFKPKTSSTASTSPAEDGSHEAHCCQKPSKKSAVTSEVTSSHVATPTAQSSEFHIAQETGVIGCSLLPKNALGITSSPRLVDGIETIAETTSPVIPLMAQLPEAEFARPLFPQNRSGTHLRCCIFLI